MEAKHPIRVVSRRTGLTPDVLRAWERRYEAVTPTRLAGRRLYTDEDVERIILLRRATEGGRSIGQVANLPTDELEAMVKADEEASGRVVARQRRADPDAASYFEEAMAATRDLDGRRLSEVLGRASVALGKIALAEQVIVPLLRRIGDDWQTGSLRVAHEHLASAILRTYLGTVAASEEEPSSSGRIVVATPAGQHHELGALLVVATAVAQGWGVTYLGPNLPAEEIAAAATAKGARVVALSIVHPADDLRLGDELKALRRYLPDDILIIVGGSGASGYDEDLRAMGASRFDSLDTLPRFLETVS
jgi:methylmalonyl-CoA mutase cobalamin-binding domain/chain